MLKYKEIKYFEVDYSDLNDFISEQYDREFEIVADQELMNDVSKTVTVKRAVLNPWELKDLEEWKLTGRKNWMLYTLLTDLCNRNLIPEGKYLINISW